jgi:CheY-like chemotaxis protein
VLPISIYFIKMEYSQVPLINEEEQHAYSLAMIIDDEEIHSFAAEVMVRKNKFAKKTIAFTGAQQALNYLLAAEEDLFPDFIFLDINMPKMNGFDFLDEYAKLPEGKRKKCSVSLLSSTRLPEDLERIDGYKSLCGYIEKPLSKAKLSACRKKAA